MQKRTVLFINWGKEELPPSILADSYDLQYIASEEALLPFIRRQYPSLIIIDKLRSKIQSDNYPWDIKTVYCIGYKLEFGKQHNSLKLAALN